MEELGKSRRKQTKPRPIARKRYNYLYLLLSILFFISTLYIFYNFPPGYNLNLSKINIPVKIPIFPIFIISLSIFIFSIVTFITKRRLQGAIFIVFIISYLFMRIQGLTHWIFLGLLIALFITVELFIIKKK